MRTNLLAAAIAATVCVPAHAAITLIGTGQIPGNAVDQSGLVGMLEDGVTPHNQVGGLGSAIAYSGVGNLYYATPDRGPADGATSYIDRLYAVRIALRPIAPYGTNSYAVTPSVVATTLLAPNLSLPNLGAKYTGSSAAFDPTNSTNSLRFDPEGVRLACDTGSVFVSDEYGPFLYRFNILTGRRIGAVPLPTKLLIDAPFPLAPDELSNNAFGRQANRGMEGLAISPDGTKLYGLMQSPLIQDGGLSLTNSRVGTNARLVEIDLATGAFREFLYVLDNKSNGLNEILAINDHQFLVIERDGLIGPAAVFKSIIKIDITGATDIRNLKALPSTGVPGGVVPVTKTGFINLLDPAFGLAATIPEKIEGLAFGPRLIGNRQSLIVTSDNDFMTAKPSLFYAFGIDAADLPDFQAQKRGCQ